MTADNLTMIVPVRNRAHLISQTLDMIACQEVLPCRLVIVDNNSTDATAEVVGEWIASHTSLPMQVDLMSEPVRGASAARNRGLATVTTRYVMCFDSDDLMHPTHISNIVKELGMRQDVELLYFDRMIRDEDMWTEIKSVADSDLIRAQILHSILSTQSYVATTELVRRAGGWDEELTRWNDYELGVRLLVEKPVTLKLTTDPSVVIIHREDSISATSMADDAEVLERSLLKIRESLTRAAAKAQGEEAAHLLHAVNYVNVRRVVLSALVAREGNEEKARELFARATANLPGRDVTKLRVIEAVVRLLGRGGSAAGKLLFREKKARD